MAIVTQHRRHSRSNLFLGLVTLGVSLCFVALDGRRAMAQAEADEDLAIGEGVPTAATQYPEIQDALVRFRNTDFQGAKQLLEVASSNHPELPPAGVMLAQMFFAAKQTAAARASLEEEVKEAPGDPEPYAIFGQLALSERRVTDAEQLFAAANRLAASYTQNAKRKQGLQARALSGMASVAEARADWPAAEKQLRELVKATPDDVNAQTRLARALFKQGTSREKEAYNALTAVFKANPAVTRPEITMALWYFQEKRSEDLQRQLIDRAATRAADDLKTQLAAAQWALDTGNVAMAKKHAQNAATIDKNSVQAQLQLGMIARFERDLDAAEAALQRAHVLSPSDFRAVNNLALTLIEQPDEQKRRQALAYATINSRVYSDLNQQNGREAIVSLAWVYFRLGKEVEADAALQKLIQIRAAVTAESAYFAAKIFQARGKPQAALQILQPALKQPTAFPERQDAEDLRDRLQATLNSTN